MNQPTVREINAHVFAGTGVCMVYANGWQMRISRARTRQGTKEGRVINLHTTDPNVEMPLKDPARVNPFATFWQMIPPDATVELL